MGKPTGEIAATSFLSQSRHHHSSLVTQTLRTSAPLQWTVLPQHKCQHQTLRNHNTHSLPSPSPQHTHPWKITTHNTPHVQVASADIIIIIVVVVIIIAVQTTVS